MFELQTNTPTIDAQRKAHEARAAAFTGLFRMVPRLVSSLRHSG
ncbi:hypothetical protein [Litoreibacter roseus]|uniref:Uncharacterized protein n=1 Tax=Litoreibacter roseus TaxID=2601869 RepID=A0A6N6JM66_9RHOB|nr:hypothetical protein [Litoreibacter roseus]GFE66368.1 hypothetical protein KIN_34420 [Litoreibacter roseus]